MFGMRLFSIRLMELFWLVLTGKQVGFHQTTEADESLHLAKELADELELERANK
jgi:C4-dicarboxylate transporter DctQ subunit